MLNLITAILIILVASNTVLMAYIGANLMRYRDAVTSNVQEAINDVATQIADKFTDTMRDPNVKRAMSIIGKESGVVRAEKATLNKFNENLPNVIPSLGLIGEKLGMEPLELMQLWGDPIVGPIIQGVVGSFVGEKGLNRGSNQNMSGKLRDMT